MATTITANGINFPDGSAGSPSIGGTDTNTGLFTGSDIIGFSTGGSERLRIDASGYVGIGNTSMGSYHSKNLVINSHDNGGITLVSAANEASGITFADGTGTPDKYTGFIQYDHSNNAITFGTNGGSERLRIDASGNVILGSDNVKLQIGASQDLYFWHNGSTGNSNISNVTGDLYIQGNNGSGTAVNQIAIKSNAAVELNYQGTKKFETTASGLKVTAANSSGQAFELYNTDSSAVVWKVNGEGDGFFRNTYPLTDSNLDLGYHATNKWRDVVLSGGVRFGNNTDSNYLDDYEEGTFTPALGGDGNHSTYHVDGSGWYTKVGRKVDIHLTIDNKDLNNSASGTVMITGLPFVSNSSMNPIATTDLYCYNVDFNTSRIQSFYLTSDETRIFGIESVADGAWVSWPVSDWNDGGMYLRLHLVYYAS